MSEELMNESLHEVELQNKKKKVAIADRKQIKERVLFDIWDITLMEYDLTALVALNFDLQEFLSHLVDICKKYD